MCKTISFYYLFIVLATLFLVVSGDASPFISDDEIKNKGLDKVLDAINQLIREHKDTYDNPEVLENFSNAIKNSEESMKKKEEEEEEKPEIVEEEKEEEEKPEIVEEKKEEEEQKPEIVEEKKEEEQKPEIVEEKKKEEQKPEIVEEEKEEEEQKEEEEENDDDDGDNDKNKGINDTLDAINKLIREHKDTYDRPEVLENFANAIKNREESLKKKENEKLKRRLY
jgi:outer membrane biosynthesis protein TonB